MTSLSPLSRIRELLRQDALVEAAAVADAELERSPADPELLRLRGIVANRQRDHVRAIAMFARALAIRPDDAASWLALGNAYARSDALDEAAAAYREVIAREPRWTEPHLNLGIVRKRRGELLEAARAFHAAWSIDPMLFDAAKHCVAALAAHVRNRSPLSSKAAGHAAHDGPSFATAANALRGKTFGIVVCSIDDAKRQRIERLYRRLFAGVEHELVVIRDARSLASAYNACVARSAADYIVLSHDDIGILADDFAQRIAALLQGFDAVGVVGSTQMRGPAVGWSGHPHLRGWIAHRASDSDELHADVLDPRPLASDVVVLDGVLIAARRRTLVDVPFDAATFDGFHLYDLDWSYRAAQAGKRLAAAGELLVVHASRGAYDDVWERYADRFCVKHRIYRTPPAPSSFFGAGFADAEQVRAFFALLGELSRNVSA